MLERCPDGVRPGRWSGHRTCRRSMLRRKVAALLMLCAAVGSGCSSGQPSDELMVSDNPTAATPARSPAAGTPAGAVLPLAGSPTSMVVADDLLAVAVDST